MKAIAIAALLATIGLSAGAAFADTSTVNANGVSQNQSGSRNKQDMELGIVDMSAFGNGKATVNATNIRQNQSGSRNTQSMVIGKIDKTFGSHTVNVTANNVSQTQSGSRNSQKLRIGVVE